MAAEEDFSAAQTRLEKVILDACDSWDEWPAQVTAGIYAGIDFVLANPQVARALVIDSGTSIGFAERYHGLVGRLADLIRQDAPVSTALSPQIGEALVGGMVGLVGDHLRVGRINRLAELRPELVLLVLLPYLGFEEAQLWANRAAEKGNQR